MATDTVVFRKLRDEEEVEGYRVICDTVDWLKTKGISLWEKPLPRAIYTERQKQGQNYGLFVGGKLAVILSLIPGVPSYWTADVGNPGATWLCAMATADAFRHRQLGSRALMEAKALLAGRGETEVYLDCKPGFLEGFYKAAGFSPIIQRDLDIPHASTREPIRATLMRYSLA